MTDDKFDMFRVDALPITPSGLREYGSVMRESCGEPSDDIFHLGYEWADKPHRTVGNMKQRLFAAADEIERLRAALLEIIQKDALTGETVFVGDFGKIARAALAEGKSND